MTQHDISSRPASTIATGDADRIAELCRLLPLWPAELADTSRAGRIKVLATIERAIRAERRRGRAGHWAYDLARHAALFRLYKRERAALGIAGSLSPQKK